MKNFLREKHLYLVALILVFFLLFTKSVGIGFVLSVLYIGINSYCIGKTLLKNSGTSLQIYAGLFCFFSFISGLGSLIYYFYKLNTLGSFLLLISLPVAFFIINYQYREDRVFENIKHEQSPNPLPRISFYLFVVLFLFSAFQILSIILNNPITESVRSPWIVFPQIFFLWFGLLTLSCLFISYTSPRQTNNRHFTITTILPTVLFSLFFVSLGILIFPNGFGFDPYIHQATEKFIIEHGEITPKPAYYLGQYALVVILTKMFHIDVMSVDKILLPLLFSLFLVPSIFLLLSKTLIADRKIALVSSFCIFLWPMTFFINTTPQGLSNLILIVLIFSSLFLVENFRKNFFILFIILSLCTVAIHPIAGIPIFLFLLILGSSYIKHSKLKISSIVLLSVISVFVFPILFAVNSGSIANNINIKNIFSDTIATIGYPTLPNRFGVVTNFVEMYIQNLRWVVVILAFIGNIKLYKKSKKYIVFPTMFCLLLLGYGTTRGVTEFSGIISYERDNFSMRIVEIAFYFLFPSALYTLSMLIEKLFTSNRFLKLFFFFIIAILITTSLYQSYPRHDRYINGRSFNMSSVDKGVVHIINTLGHEEKFAVLANQTISAAALQAFGFENYYTTSEGTLYFYPIPTSGPLYQIYLDMVYTTPSQDNALRAMDLMKTDVVYLVLNEYWWDFKKVATKASLEATSTTSVNNGQVYIFEYRR